MNAPPLYSYGGAFIFDSPYENWHDIQTVIHEFGHYNETFHGYRHSIEYVHNVDVAEIHSQGLELLCLEYADEIETIKKNYRNPSAHTGELTEVNAKDCFDIVLDVEKLLKRMLDSFQNVLIMIDADEMQAYTSSAARALICSLFASFIADLMETVVSQ